MSPLPSSICVLPPVPGRHFLLLSFSSSEFDLRGVRRRVHPPESAVAAPGRAPHGAVGRQGVHVQDLRQGVQDVRAPQGAHEEPRQDEVRWAI